MNTPSRKTSKGSHAVVIGGGIGGLASAIALSKHFERVSIIERDQYLPESDIRNHTPQGHHAHILLARGLSVFTRLVPSFPEWLDELGLYERDLTQDVRFCFGGKWMPKMKSGIPFRPCTRSSIERLLLRAVQQSDNIVLRSGCTVSSLIGRSTITGVEITNEDREQETLQSEWTVASMGRSSKLAQWLRMKTDEEFSEEIVDPGITYTSYLFKPSSELAGDWTYMSDVDRYPDQPEMAVVVVLGEDRWLVSLMGYGKASPPRNVEEFIERTRKLSSPDIANVLESSTATTELRNHSNTANRRCRFGRMKSWPERFVVVGDSVCALNPRYGQGMTTSSIAAEMLLDGMDEHWHDHASLDGFARKYQRSLDRALEIPWQMALLEDRLWVEKFAHRNRRSPTQQLTGFIVRRLLDTAFSDVTVYSKFMRVAHMVDSPSIIFDVGTLAKLALPRLRSQNRGA